MRTILISIDHKWRDLAGYVYIKKLLEERGYRVLLIRNNFEEFYSDVYNPEAVLMIHLYDKNVSDRAKRLKERGISIFLMPTEGIPTLKSIRAFAAGKFADLSPVDLQFVWSDEMKNIMVEQEIVDDSKIKVVGVPRFDFYRSPLKDILLTKEELYKKYKFKHNYPLITWATNFAQASFAVKNRDFIKKDWAKYKLDNILDPEKIPQRDFESREIIFENLMRLVRDIRNINLLIKLHPSEDHMYYYNKIRELPDEIKHRIRIVNREYIWDILNSTDILMKRSCTTGVEAWLLNKPTIELKLNPDEWYFSPEHASGSDVVEDYDGLLNRVLYYLNGGSIPEDILSAREEFIKKWCYKVDGKSSLRFVEEVDSFLKNKLNSVKAAKLTFKKIKSYIIVFLMEAFDFKIHDLRVYGLRGNVDKLGRVDKYFHRKDERYWERRLGNCV